jgi:hypothetical protein
LEAAKEIARGEERKAERVCRQCGQEPVAGPGSIGEKCRKARQELYQDHSRGAIKRRLRELVQRDRIPLPLRLRSIARFLVGRAPIIPVTTPNHWRPREGTIRAYAAKHRDFEGFIIVEDTAAPSQVGGLKRIACGAYLVTREPVRGKPTCEKLAIQFIPTKTEVPWRQYAG